jgi:hypothetical protein
LQGWTNSATILLAQPVSPRKHTAFAFRLLTVNNSSWMGRWIYPRRQTGTRPVKTCLKCTVMERDSDPSADVMTLQLHPGEVLALYGFLALGAHFAAVISGEDSPFSPDEIRSHITTIGESASNTLMDKLVGAVAAVVQDRARLPKSSPAT